MKSPSKCCRSNYGFYSWAALKMHNLRRHVTNSNSKTEAAKIEQNQTSDSERFTPVATANQTDSVNARRQLHTLAVTRLQCC